MTKRNLKTKAFGRDVLINVLANLIAAAIIYVLGVLTGLFPHNPRALSSALSVIFTGGCFLVMMATRMFGGDPRLASGRNTHIIGGAVASFLLGCALVAVGALGGKFADWELTALWQRSLSVAAGLLLVAMPSYLVYEAVAEHRQRAKAANRPRLPEPTVQFTRRRRR